MHIRIHIADDHAVFRSGLRALLEKEEDFEVISETGTGYDTVKAALKENVDLLLLDISMPGLSSSDVAKTILQKCPDFPIVILTMHEDEYYLREFLQIGVHSYVLKKSTGNELLQGIRSAIKGQFFVDPALSKYVATQSYSKIKSSQKSNELDMLSKTEKEVLRLLAFGHTNVEISCKLEISEKTVKLHRSNIMAKLQINTRAELVRFTIDNNLMKM